MIILLKAALLAVVEGVTEFLPISSTGHMIIVDAFVRLTDDDAFNKAFMIVIQLPAILAVVAYFWREIWPFSRTGDERREMLTMWVKIVIAVVPALVIGKLLDEFLEAHLFAPIPVAIALIFGGIILIMLERMNRQVRFDSVKAVPLSTAVLIGFIQCLAMLPGTSRSAATIIGAMFLGVSRRAAAEFSFFLAIPTMFAATGYKMLKSGFHFTGQQWAVLAVGSVISFAVAYAAIAAFMNYIRTRSFTPFGYYRIALGVLVLVAAWAGWLDV